MTPATLHPVLTPQCLISTVVAGDLSSSVKSLCKPDLPIKSPVEVKITSSNSMDFKTSQHLEFGSAISVNSFFSVTDCEVSSILRATQTSPSVVISPKVSENLPVEAASLFCPVNFYSPNGTCASTGSSGDSPSVPSSLSPFAEPFEVAETAP